MSIKLRTLVGEIGLLLICLTFTLVVLGFNESPYTLGVFIAGGVLSLFGAISGGFN